MEAKIKRIWNIVTTVLVVVMVVIAMLLWGVQFFGLEIFFVQSGSMEPEYPVGSVVYVAKTDPADLEVGDVVTFNINDSTRGTHRIIEIVEENGEVAFRTKGDANDHADNGLVEPANIVGRVVFSLPYMGFFVNYIQQPPGMYVALACVAALLLLLVLPDVIFDNKQQKTKEEEQTHEH